MRFYNTRLPGVYEVELEPFQDERGLFTRTFCQEAFQKIGFHKPIAQINHHDAEQLGIGEGDRVKVISRRGELETFVRPGNIVPQGAIFMDFHFAESNSNILLGTSLDPVSRTPDYKVCAVKLEVLS